MEESFKLILNKLDIMNSDVKKIKSGVNDLKSDNYIQKNNQAGEHI